MTEKESLVALSSFVPFGPARIKLLVSYFGSARKAWKASEKSLKEIGLGEEKTRGFIDHRNAFGVKGYFDRINQAKIEMVTQNDKNFPENLRDLEDAPACLYVKGSLTSADSNAVAIVGTRKMTSYGREVALKFASELASFSITVVSGLARGVDTEAHKAALSVHGRTVAVVACGLDVIYPPENLALSREVVKSGAIISEYPLGYPAKPANFASRNRIISGLAKAVVVVEGAAKSGTLLTASRAAEQGRTVFAVPGQITSPLSVAPHFLIRNGARMVTSTADILEELNMQIIVDSKEVEKVMPSDKLEAEILSHLENESLHLDEIARISSLDVGKLSARLTVMEIKGLVRNLGKGVYKKN